MGELRIREKKPDQTNLKHNLFVLSIFRNRLESNSEHWNALLLSLRELTEWVIRKDTELSTLGIGPLRGDAASLQKQLVSIKSDIIIQLPFSVNTFAVATYARPFSMWLQSSWMGLSNLHRRKICWNAVLASIARPYADLISTSFNRGEKHVQEPKLWMICVQFSQRQNSIRDCHCERYNQINPCIDLGYMCQMHFWALSFHSQCGRLRGSQLLSHT